MDNQSIHGFDSDESDLDMHAEAYEHKEGIEDLLSENLGLCSWSLTRDKAREFYVAYGRRSGFTVWIHHNRHFVCSKEGFRAQKYVHRKDRVLPPPPVTRRKGCQAMIRLAQRDGLKWVVTKFVKEHNHKLMNPSKVPWWGSGKHLASEDEKDKRIRGLSLELHNVRQKCKRRCAAYEEQLNIILKDLERHRAHVKKSFRYSSEHKRN
ncbi:unnamed protein product [Malus baccata var. baccata]